MPVAATSANQSATGSGWSNREALAFDAPDLTVIQLGANDISTGVAVATCVANVQALITTAKATGDVLLMFMHPGRTDIYPTATMQSYNSNLAALAASNNVPFMSMFDYFGQSFSAGLQARMFDGIVHGNSGLYAEEAAVVRDCIRAMNGGTL